jgi:hypothetical protein
MGRRNDRRTRRRLALKTETIRALSAADLGRVAGGTWTETGECFGETFDCWTAGCDTTDCWYTNGSRFC